MKYRIEYERSHYFAPAINVAMLVNISGNPPEQELITAIKNAVNQHELLSSKIESDESGYGYYVPKSDDQVHMEIVPVKSHEDWKEIIKSQAGTPFKLLEGDLVRFFILKATDKTQLLIIAHHLAGDGTAMLYLVRDIMNWLNSPLQATQPNPIRLLSRRDFPGDAKLGFLLRCMIKYLNKQWIKEKKVFSIDEYEEMCKEFWKDRNTKILVSALENNQLNNLKVKSKENGVTINSAITTAFLKAASNEAEIGIAASIRPKGFEGMGNYASGISIKYRYDIRKNFWSNALKVQKLFSKKLSNNSKKYFLLNFLNELEPNLIDAAYFNAFMDFKSSAASKVSKMFGYKGNPKGVSISNLTKAPIPENYGGYNIESIILVPPLVPNAKRIIGVVTVGDRMTVAMQVEDGENIGNEERIFNQAVKDLNSINI